MINKIVKSFSEKILHVLNKIINFGGKVEFDPLENIVTIKMDYEKYTQVMEELIPTVNFRFMSSSPLITNFPYTDPKTIITKHRIGEFKFILKKD